MPLNEFLFPSQGQLLLLLYYRKSKLFRLNNLNKYACLSLFFRLFYLIKNYKTFYVKNYENKGAYDKLKLLTM